MAAYLIIFLIINIEKIHLIQIDFAENFFFWSRLSNEEKNKMFYGMGTLTNNSESITQWNLRLNSNI